MRPSRAEPTAPGPSTTSGSRPRELGAPAAAVALALLLLLVAAGCGQDQTQQQPEFVCAPPVGSSPVRGPDDAWVTIIEHADFECPYCRNLQPTLREVESTYPDDVRVVFKNLPLSFHERAMPAAIAAECAHEQGKFWLMHDRLFARGDLSEDGLLAAAVYAGVDLPTWQTCRGGTGAQARVAADVDMAYMAGVTGTPMLFINGRGVLGAVSFDDLQPVIEDALDEARSSGIDAAAYYETAVPLCGVAAP